MDVFLELVATKAWVRKNLLLVVIALTAIGVQCARTEVMNTLHLLLLVRTFGKCHRVGVGDALPIFEVLVLVIVGLASSQFKVTTLALLLKSLGLIATFRRVLNPLHQLHLLVTLLRTIDDLDDVLLLFTSFLRLLVLFFYQVFLRLDDYLADDVWTRLYLVGVTCWTFNRQLRCRLLALN